MTLSDSYGYTARFSPRPCPHCGCKRLTPNRFGGKIIAKPALYCQACFRFANRNGTPHGKLITAATTNAYG